jgi:lipoprotein-releasing system permease protein
LGWKLRASDFRDIADAPHCPCATVRLNRSHELRIVRASNLILTPFEWTIAKRYMMPGRGEAIIAVVASIGVGVVTLSVALLVIVMSVMNGFRGEMFDKIVGVNGHAIIQAYGGRLENWQQVLQETRATPGVTRASPLIEQPLLATFNGRVEAIAVRGNMAEDIARLKPKLQQGNLAELQPEAGNVAVGAQLARTLGAQVGDTITIINPQGRSTPVGTIPREVGYNVAAIFEIGIYDLDARFVVMPMQDAQSLLLTGDAVQMIEVQTNDPDNVGAILAPLSRRLAGQAEISDWKSINSSLFEALQVERVAMFFALSFIVIVAAFNILSSLIMLVRSKNRDIAILRTMGATRRNVLKIYVTIGSIIGALGTFAGLLLGAIVLFFRQSIIQLIQLLTGQDLWDPSIRFLAEVPSRSDPMEILMIAVMALLFSFLATLYPAFRAASTDPVQVLRYE